MGEIALATMLCFDMDGLLTREEQFPDDWEGNYSCYMEKGNVRRFKRTEILQDRAGKPIWVYEEHKG
jgi:hypothetical protein